MPKKKNKIKKVKTKTKASPHKSKTAAPRKASKNKGISEFQFRERRLCDIKLVERHPTPESKKYNDTLPLPFGGEVKKDAMREHGLFH